MNRIRVHETVGGRRLEADDTNDRTSTEGTDMTTIKDQFLAEADERERELARHLRGDFTTTAPSWATASDGAGDQLQVSTRDAFYAREAEMSRRPPSGRIFERSTATSTDDDDDDSVSAPSGLSARDTYLQHAAERSRLPARGSR
jgi:hypothetical protein